MFGFREFLSHSTPEMSLSVYNSKTLGSTTHRFTDPTLHVCVHNYNYDGSNIKPRSRKECLLQTNFSYSRVCLKRTELKPYLHRDGNVMFCSYFPFYSNTFFLLELKSINYKVQTSLSVLLQISGWPKASSLSSFLSSSAL